MKFQQDLPNIIQKLQSERIPAVLVPTIIGGISGLASYFTMLAISAKLVGRQTVSRKEVIWASLAVSIGSSLAYFFIKSKEESEA